MNTAAIITREQVLEVVNGHKHGKHTTEIQVPPFPLDAFPEMLADYARELHRCNGYPQDYTGAGFLFAASAAIGNSVHLRVREGYTVPPILWLVLVGRPSIGKTHPLNAACSPLAKRDAKAKRTHGEALAAWEAEEAARRIRKTKDGTTEERPNPRPIWRPHLVDDITMEALLAKLSLCPRGVGLHCDELVGWLAGMDKYRKGGDRQKWLSLFNGSQVSEIRKTAGELLVERPCVSVAGGVQPSRLDTLGRDHDGFLHRLLFVYPDEQVKQYARKTSVSKEWGEAYTSMLEQLLAFEMRMEEGELVPVLLVHSNEAAEAYTAWDRMNTDRINEANTAGNELSAALFGKLDTYVHRLALVLEMLQRVCTGVGQEKEVGITAMEGALRLVEYFEATARKVHFQLFEADAVDRLPGRKARVYAALPERFATGDGLKIAEALGMPSSSFKRFLREGKLFRKLDHGVNIKLMEA
mgnify:CR=1 FL=1